MNTDKRGNRLSSCCEDSYQVAQFRFDLVGARYRMRNLVPEQFAVSLTQPMHRRFDGTFTETERPRQFIVGLRCSLTHQARIQCSKQFGLAFFDVLFAKPIEHLFEQSHSPSALKMLLGRFVIGRLAGISGFCRVKLKGQHGRPATPFLGTRLVPFIRQKMGHRREQKSAESSLLPVSAADPMMLQKPREEFLRQVLRIMR